MASFNPNPVPHPSQHHQDIGYGTINISQPQSQPTNASTATDFAPGGNSVSSPLSQSIAKGRFTEDFDRAQRGVSIIDDPTMQRSDSVMSQGDTLNTPSRGSTLKKKPSLKRGGSMKRSSSRRSSRAGSVRSLALQSATDTDEMHSAFFSPIPTSGNPTEILANRFQAWRKVLKDLITYFREIQSQYDHRSKSILKVSNVINNTSAPTMFLSSGGLDDALQVLRDYHKTAFVECNKSKDIENDVILALVGLRSDLNTKIKEIKSLSGDFKNSVEKEMETTRKLVKTLQDGLGKSEIDTSQTTGRSDPFLLKLTVDRQIEKQIDEENYLHQAYLNLETSGRELEAIVVGEIQKSYNAYAGILKREADAAYSTVEDLRTGPIAMPKDHEWNSFVEKDEHFVDPRIPVRESHTIHYPGRDSELAQEVRAGLMERKSKFLKSYTPGWYVLSPTHLHEFKSADKSQAPIMSLYLPEQKLGSHSDAGASSNKFMLKGRQTGAMHHGHSWVLRCESYDTMMAWYNDIRDLIEKSPEDRKVFVRQHARSFSGTSQRSNSRAGSVSSDGIMDEDDEEPFSAKSEYVSPRAPKQDVLPKRPNPGGRFPSDLEVSTARGLQVPLSPQTSSESSRIGDHHLTAPAGNNLSGGTGYGGIGQEDPPTHGELINKYAEEDGVNPYTSRPVAPDNSRNKNASDGLVVGGAGFGGAALGAAGYQAYRNHEDEGAQNRQEQIQPGCYEQNASAAAPLDQRHEGEKLAAYEATLIAAPDAGFPSSTLEHRHEPEKLATYEAAWTPDADHSAPSANYYIPGGLRQGDVADTHNPDLNTSVQKGPEQKNPAEVILDPLAEDLARDQPSIAAGQNHHNASISQLHIPGEFPRNSSYCA